jgi:hypothetical protein
MANNANDLTNKLLVEIPKRLSARCWRQNVGSGYPVAAVQGAIHALEAGNIALALKVLRNSRPIAFGQAGLPDIDGIAAPSGRRIGVEVKFGKDKMRPEQERCREMYERHGGLYIVARDVEQAMDEIKKGLVG